jgi:hypothetical protein
MGEARGFGGKRNLSAAVAYWRDAAARGDGYARFELAQLYFQGAAVEADSEKAIELFRQASDQGIIRASFALSSVLVSKSMAGDVDATQEALRLLDLVARTAPDAKMRTAAHFQFGLYLTDIAPSNLKDPARAIDHFKMAARGGDSNGLRALARAYENGVGVAEDLGKAAGYLALIREPNARANGLGRRLTAADLEKGKSFQLSQDPPSPEFRKIYEVRQSLPGTFKSISPNLGPPRAASGDGAAAENADSAKTTGDSQRPKTFDEVRSELRKSGPGPNQRP